MITTTKVLVAEDDPMAVVLLKRAFATTRTITTFRFVTDGQEAIDYLSGTNQYADRDEYPLPDLMLLDIRMPRLDGFEVLDWLRKQPGLKRLPVTMFSTSDMQRDIDRAYELGANSFLVKPQQPDSMSELVRRFEEYWLDLNRGPVRLSEQVAM
jgi:CheY-like chemotaxis protein